MEKYYIFDILLSTSITSLTYYFQKVLHLWPNTSEKYYIFDVLLQSPFSKQLQTVWTIDLCTFQKPDTESFFSGFFHSFCSTTIQRMTINNMQFPKLGAVLNLCRNPIRDTPWQTVSTVIIRNQPMGQLWQMTMAEMLTKTQFRLLSLHGRWSKYDNILDGGLDLANFGCIGL